jgi:hypothetical protein
MVLKGSCQKKKDSPPQDDRHENCDPGEREERPGCDECRQRDERIEVEEPLHRPSDIVLPRLSARSEEEDEQPEESPLRDDAQDLKGAAFFRSFAFQSEVSPVGKSRGPAPGPSYFGQAPD